MPIRSENDPRYYRRFLLMGLGAAGFALWALYDGAIGYPAAQERALAFEKLHREQRTDEWEAYAAEQGWSAAIPEESKSEEEFHGKIVEQYVMAGVTGAIGLYLLSLPLRARGRWIESSDTGLTSSWGQTLNFDDVIALDKRQWRKKGIAKVLYNDRGGKRRFVLDNYKFDRPTTDAILYQLEQRIDPAVITGGPPEPSPEPDVDEAAGEPDHAANLG